MNQTDKIKQVVKEHWDNRAASFDDAAHHAIHSPAQRDAWLEVLRGLCGERPLRVLDIGCGTGFLSLLLAEMGNEVDGLDIAPTMLERARAKAEEASLHVTFFEGDAESLRAPDATYDLVIERHVIWTLPDPDAALREWRRVLRPGGRAALIEGDWGRHDNAPTGYEQIHASLPLYGGTPSTVLAERLTAAGLPSVRIQPLIASDLWGEDVKDERYLITGRAPS